MKTVFFIINLLLISGEVFSQTPNNDKKSEKPPTQKELQEMMQEMQMTSDSLTDEEKEEMAKMSFKMPDMKALQATISGVNDTQLKKAWEDDSRIIPKRDEARIAKTLATKLTSSAIPDYSEKIRLEVLNKLSENTKKNGATILQQTRQQKKSVANTALGLWINGKPTLALYLMGEAIKENPTNGNNLNNYAAMLSMCGAEQLALPILNNLNKRYPKNSSILNNMTQAWLGLGDIDRANKYADSTLRIAAYHPQANMAKCLIEESKGNTTAAIEVAKKAIKSSFSLEKQNKLQSLGYTVKPDDLNWDKPMPQDPMGLEKFVWPEYPKSVEESMILEKKWEAFKEECNKRLIEVRAKRDKAEQDWEAAKENRTKLAMLDKPNEQSMPYPLSAIKAMTKLNYLISEDSGPNMTFVFANEYNQLTETTSEKLDGFSKVMETSYNEFNKKYKNQFGEGLSNPYAAACSDENEIRNKYLNTANGFLEQENTYFLKLFRRKASDHLYYIQYTTWPEDFEISKLNAQISWLTFISQQQVVFKDKSSYCNAMPNKPKTNAQLQYFDDVACKYVSTMNMGIFSITQQCSNLITKWDFQGIQFDMKDNIETNRFNGTVIIGVSKSFEGPMGTEVEVSAGGKVDFDNSGITDVGVIAGAEAKVGGRTILGVEATMTLNSGTSVAGKGILQGINN